MSEVAQIETLIDDAMSIAKSTCKLARVLKVSQSTIYHWKQGGAISAVNKLRLEKWVHEQRREAVLRELKK
jgi:DNA invertase Pin-like site-specific DNA recombinase